MAKLVSVILATGYANMDTVATVMDLGQVLKKPFRIDDLDVAVRSALSLGAPDRASGGGGFG